MSPRRTRSAFARAAALAALLSGAGCAVGPSYHTAAVVPATTQVGAGGRGTDSIRAFFDSLAATRARDTLRAVPRVSTRRVAAESLADLAWLDIVRDTALQRLIDTALRRNRDLTAAEARIREYRADVGVARGPLFPSLTVNGSASTNQVAFAAFAPIAYKALRLTGDVAWELDFWGQTRRGITAAHADLAAQDAARRAAVLSLVSDVATGYLQVLELDQERRIAQQTLRSRQVTLELARQRFGRGVISELDVRQFEAQVAVPAVRLAQVEQLEARQEHALNVLVGEGPAPIPRGGSLVAAARAVAVPDSLPSTLLARRPDVQEAERAYAAATARVGVADAARLPTISIVGSYGSQSPTAASLFGTSSKVYQLLGSVSVPLFTGGKLESEARAARARADQARAQYEQTVLTALQDAGDALAGVRASRDEVAADETQATALRRGLDLAQLRYRTGVASYLEVLDAERGLFDAELALSRAQLQQLTAAVQLYKALGGNWPGMRGHD